MYLSRPPFFLFSKIIEKNTNSALFGGKRGGKGKNKEGEGTKIKIKEGGLEIFFITFLKYESGRAEKKCGF